MTQEEKKRFLHLVNALVDGKIIQVFTEEGVWEDTDAINFNNSSSFYRIKTKGNIRPYKGSAEFLEALRKHDIPYITHYRGAITEVVSLIYDDSVTLGIEAHYTYKELLQYCTWSDGTACGVTEEE